MIAKKHGAELILIMIGRLLAKKYQFFVNGFIQNHQKTKCFLTILAKQCHFLSKVLITNCFFDDFIQTIKKTHGFLTFGAKMCPR